MPTPIRWQVPIELSPEEARVAAVLHRTGKFYVFLRKVRAELFDDAFQAELAAVYQPRGTAPLPGALLAMVTLLQAYTQVSDADAVVAAQVDRRWQLVLGCLGATEAPFSQGALVKFRERMIAHDLDRALLDRTVTLAKQTGHFGWQALRAALDSSPLVGRGRVEDTWNLLGRALRTVVTCAATTLQIPREQVLAGAGVTLLGAPSLKAALDIDWGDPGRAGRCPGAPLGRSRPRRGVGRGPRAGGRRARPCRRPSPRSAASWPKTWSRIRRPASAASGAASHRIACPPWGIPRCGTDAKRGRSCSPATSAM